MFKFKKDGEMRHHIMSVGKMRSEFRSYSVLKKGSHGKRGLLLFRCQPISSFAFLTKNEETCRVIHGDFSFKD